MGVSTLAQLPAKEEHRARAGLWLPERIHQVPNPPKNARGSQYLLAQEYLLRPTESYKASLSQHYKIYMLMVK